MKNPEIESQCPSEIKENKGISRDEKFIRVIFAGSILLTTACSNHTPNEAQASEVDDKDPQGEVYLPSEEELGEGLDGSLTTEENNQDFIFTPDFLTSPEEFCFLPPDVGSGLDSEGFIVEEEIEIVEEDVFAQLETNLNPEVKEILSMQPKLSFDNNGKLNYRDEGDSNPVLTVETDRHLIYPYEQLNDVKFFVIHYDGAPQTLASGGYRTVLNTINGLNREGNPSVQFCVDSYPVNNEFINKDGVGIILSQVTGPMPYKGRHVMIGYDLETGREDLNRVKTADLYEQVGVGQDFVDFIRAGYKDFDSFSLGVEQVGTNYSYNFPEQFPPEQQIANVLALIKAASERYGLSAWDIVGHHEIQEKGDPGDEYMLTLRFLLGLSYLLDEQLPDDFLETEDPYDYFVKLRDYSIARMGEERYMRWNEIYGMEKILGNSPEEEMKGTEEVDIKYYNEGSHELTAYEAILAATREFAGNPYSWDAENHHCSGYVAQYFKYLGFPIDLVMDPVSTYSPERGDPMPNATTVKQVKYLKMITENYGEDLASEITLKEMLSNKEIWEEIPAGTVLYLPEPVGHHGYDTFTHTAIFMGLDSSQEPMFSEFSSYMKEGPEYGHGFEQFTLMYKRKSIEPYNPANGELKVFMFDAVEASKRIKLRRNSIQSGAFLEMPEQGGKIIH